MAFLSEEGFEVDSASTRIEAENRMKEGYALILLDISLAQGSGFGECGKAKEKGIPVIFLTASGDEMSVVKGLDKLTLKKAYLDSLSKGEYTVTAKFRIDGKDYESSATFKITSSSGGSGVKTGDDIRALILGAILFILSLSVVAYILHRKHVLYKLVPALYGASGGVSGQQSEGNYSDTDDILPETDDLHTERYGVLLERLFPDGSDRRPERNYRRCDGSDRRCDRDHRRCDGSDRRCGRNDRRRYR